MEYKFVVERISTLPDTEHAQVYALSVIAERLERLVEIKQANSDKIQLLEENGDNFEDRFLELENKLADLENRFARLVLGSVK